MAKKGKIYFVDKDFTDAEVAELFGYPCIFILKDNTGKLLKQTAYDLEGTKSMVEFKDSGSIKNYPTFADFPIPGDITTIYKALDTDELYIWDAETGTYLLSSIDDSWKNYVELSIGGLQTSIDGINEELVTIESRLDDLYDNDNSLQDQITAEITARQNADIAEANTRTFADGVLDSKITDEKNRNDTQDSAIADLNVHNITITTSTSITTNTLSTINSFNQNGRNVILSNGVNAINLTCEITSDSKFVASYTKLGSAAITFTAGSGATLVQVDGTAILNGAVGSTACLTRSGNTFYLQISNR